MSGYDEVQRQLERARSDLRHLELERSKYAGLGVPPRLLHDVEDAEATIAELEARLAAWPRDDAGQPLPTDRDFSDVEARYRRQVARAYGFLTLRGYPERDPRLSAVPLERVFIKLSTTTTRTPVFDELEIRWGPMQEKARVLRQERSGSRAIITDRELTDQETEELLLYYERQVEKLRKLQTVTLSVPEALRDHNRLVITGPPGSGKTTLLRWLALTFAEGKQAQPDRLDDAYPQKRLPVLVELRRFHERFAEERERLTTVNLADEIAAFVAEDARFEGTPVEFIRQALANGDCLVAFDGLDEIADFTARQRASAALQAFADNYIPRGNRVIVTSRLPGYKGVELGPGFQHCEINPFTPEDVSEFIHHWYEVAYPFDPATAREEADELVKAIEGNDRVARLAETPLLCTIIAIVYRNSRILPNRRVELYLQCCQALLDTWERVKEIRQSGLIGGFDWQTKLELLAPLAYWLHSEEGRTAAPEPEFARRLATELRERRLCEESGAEQEARAFLNATGERSGLLQGRGDGTVEFPHLTFQEYLAARHIAAAPDMESLLDMFMPHLHEAWWREVHLLTIGHLGSGRDGAPKASALLEAILDRYRPPLRFLRAIPYPGSRLTLSDNKAVEVLERAVEWFRTLPARKLPRWQFVRRLAWAIQRERFFAAIGLGDCAPLGVTNKGRDRVRSALEETLLLALSGHRRERNVPLLTSAASILGRMGRTSPAVVDALLTALDNGIGVWRRSEAGGMAWCLAAMDFPTGRLVARWSTTDSEVQWKEISPRIIGEAREATSCPGQPGQTSPEAVTGLLTALGDSDAYVRAAAASSLGQWGQASPEVITGLLTVLSDSDAYVRKAAASSLVQLGQTSPEVITGLLSALGDSESRVRESAASSLGQLGPASSQVITGLLTALGDSDADVRRTVASSLGELGQASPEVITALLTALGDKATDSFGERPVAEMAASSLGQLGRVSPEVITGLFSALGDSEWRVRKVAASSLVRLGQASPEVLTGLLFALDGRDEVVRRAVASSLGQLGQASPEVITALLTVLSLFFAP